MQIIITGDVQSGKSTLAAKLVKFLADRGVAMAGILALGLWKDDQRQGFDLVDLKTNEITPLARRRTDPDDTSITPFKFFDGGMAAGEKALEATRCRDAAVIMVDEVGKLELKGKGWAPSLDPLLSIGSAVHIWIVRESLVAEVCKRWNIQTPAIVRGDHGDSLERLKALCIKEHHNDN
jgi:nucleoside-triphosphatase THEP1